MASTHLTSANYTLWTDVYDLLPPGVVPIYQLTGKITAHYTNDMSKMNALDYLAHGRRCFSPAEIAQCALNSCCDCFCAHFRLHFPTGIPNVPELAKGPLTTGMVPGGPLEERVNFNPLAFRGLLPQLGESWYQWLTRNGPSHIRYVASSHCAFDLAREGCLSPLIHRARDPD